jgi:putative DNA primase/helicase
LVERALGHWPEIIGAVLGGEFLSRKHCACPVDGQGHDRFRFADTGGRGNYFCACNDGRGDGFDLIRCAKQCSFVEAMKMVESVIGMPEDVQIPRRQPIAPAWLLAAMPRPSERSAYLASRGLEVPLALRWARQVPYYDEGKELGRYDAMIAPVTRGRVLIGYHITYLDKGKKADVPAPRKLLMANMTGATCQLYPFSGGELGVGEGIETCIAAHQLFQVPVWAALNAGMLARFEWPEGVTILRIFADHDGNYAGHAAAYALAHRAAQHGITVAVHLPQDPGDWNDVLLRERAQESSAEPV